MFFVYSIYFFCFDDFFFGKIIFFVIIVIKFLFVEIMLGNMNISSSDIRRFGVWIGNSMGFSFCGRVMVFIFYKFIEFFVYIKFYAEF